MWGALEAGLTDACKAGGRALVAMWGHPDQEEGPLAFAEKREPVWIDDVHRYPGAHGHPEHTDTQQHTDNQERTRP